MQLLTHNVVWCRCHPDISRVSNAQFYNGQLIDGCTAAQRRPLSPGLSPVCFLEVRGQQQYGQGSSSASNRPEAHAVVQVCIHNSSPVLRLIWIDALVWKSPGTWTMLVVREHVRNLLRGCCMLQHSSIPRRTLPLWLNFKIAKNSTVPTFIGLHVLCYWPTCRICIRACVVMNLRMSRLQLLHHSFVCVCHCTGAKLLVMSSLSCAALLLPQSPGVAIMQMIKQLTSSGINSSSIGVICFFRAQV